MWAVMKIKKSKIMDNEVHGDEFKMYMYEKNKTLKHLNNKINSLRY